MTADRAPAPPAPTSLRAVWSLARPYWFSEERWVARGLLATIVILNLGLVGINVLLNQWNNAFFNALQEKDFAAFLHQLEVFTVLAFGYIAVAVYEIYLNLMLRIRWRRWLTDVYLDSWLGDRVYYRLELASHGRGTDNPDQRISQDLQAFASRTLSLGLGLLRAAVTLVSFVAILWGLSGPLVVPLGHWLLPIPGYMVWAALVYSVLGTWLTHLIGRPLVRLNFAQERFEADFRFGLVRLRENAEGVALYGGEEDEKRSLRTRFGAVFRNWYEIMRYQRRLIGFTAGFGQAAVIFPYLVAAPRYFSGAIQLGGLMQTAQAFGQVQDALSWFVGAYSDLADWKASVDRVTSFEAAIRAARAHARDGEGITVAPGAPDRVAIRDLALDLPDGRPLVATNGFELRAGRHALLTGPSGIGKSTVFRAIAGIWPFGHGRVEMPPGARTLFLPQRPYLTIGTLREVVSYPSGAGRFPDEAVIEALRLCQLEAFAGRLDESDHWAQRLSPGEQQRVALARALLHAPDWLFLDEATAALDDATERALYELLRARLPRTTLVSIAHRPGVAGFHQTVFRLEPGKDAAHLVPAG
jgi:vitamin B12/bleomycin/antimicrobial peptide transport system ATP-binding/permease protein